MVFRFYWPHLNGVLATYIPDSHIYGNYFNVIGLQKISSWPDLRCRVPPKKTVPKKGNVYDYPTEAQTFSGNLGGGLSFPFIEDPTLNPHNKTEESVFVLNPPTNPVDREKRPVVAYVRYSAGNLTGSVADTQRMETAATFVLPRLKRIQHGS